MRKFLVLAVSSLLCVLVFTTVVLARESAKWDFKIQGVSIIASEARDEKIYKAEVFVNNYSTNETYDGYGTVKVRLAVSNPDGGDLLFSGVESIEIKNGSEGSVEFKFSNGIRYKYLDYRVQLFAPNNDKFDEDEGNGVRVEWD